MKTLLSILMICGFTASAAVTNIIVKVTTEVNVLNGTNSTTLKFQQDGSAKDALTVDALNWYYNYAKSSGVYTNTWDEWLKDTAKAAFQQHNATKSANDFGNKLDRIATQGKTDASVFTQSQKNQIDAIYATLPPP